MTDDRLSELQAAIEKAAKQGKLSVFWAQDLSWLCSEGEAGSRGGEVLWRDGVGWEGFMDIAVASEGKVVYVDAKVFSVDDLVERLNGLETVGEPEVGSRKAKAEKFRRRDGYVEQLIVAFRAQALWHVYEETAEWVAEYSELEVESEDGENESGESDISEEVLDSCAGDVARSPSFARVRSKGDQLELTRRMLAKENPALLKYLGEIVSRARLIFQTEVAPNKELKRRS